MNRQWYVLYGAAIAFFITCGVLIPSQFLPWLSTAIMTCTAMMWHRAHIFERQMCEAWADSAERWHKVACNAMEERDALIERARDEETNRKRPTVNIHTQYREKFGEVLAEIIRRAAPEIPESETRE